MILLIVCVSITIMMVVVSYFSVETKRMHHSIAVGGRRTTVIAAGDSTQIRRWM